MYKGPNRKFNKQKKRRQKSSEYALQFVEKQKFKAIYGLREKDLKNYYLKAKRKNAPTDETLVKLVESRLDNVVYRLGWAVSRPQARQIVSHGHVLVEGKNVNIPSYQVKEKQKLQIHHKSLTNNLFTTLKEINAKQNPPLWLNRSNNFYEAQILTTPSLKDFNEPIDIKLIIEFYSR